MDAIQRYELIRPILHGEKTVKDIHQETPVPISTLKRYLKSLKAWRTNPMRFILIRTG